MPTCPNCGAELPYDAAECPACATPVAAAPSTGADAGDVTLIDRAGPSDVTLIDRAGATDATLIDAGREETFRCERCETEYADSDSCPACGRLRGAAPCQEHSDRAAHSRCVFCGRALCDHCRDDGDTPAVCPEHASVPLIQGWAQVYSTGSEMEANLIRDNLDAEGIDAQVYTQTDRSFPFDLGEMSIVRVLVPVWEHAAALQRLQASMDTEGEVVFACPSCGEVYEPGAAACGECGASLTA